MYTWVWLPPALPSPLPFVVQQGIIHPNICLHTAKPTGLWTRLCSWIMPSCPAFQIKGSVGFIQLSPISAQSHLRNWDDLNAVCQTSLYVGPSVPRGPVHWSLGLGSCICTSWICIDVSLQLLSSAAQVGQRHSWPHRMSPVSSFCYWKVVTLKGFSSTLQPSDSLPPFQHAAFYPWAPPEATPVWHQASLWPQGCWYKSGMLQPTGMEVLSSEYTESIPSHKGVYELG